MNTLISIVGPTAIGKTSLAIKVADALHSEIISADSRQFYRELTIGTAKPTAAELRAIPHHFINSHSIENPLSAGDYESEGIKKINQLFFKHSNLVMVGGSGLFVNAITEGLDHLPKAKEGVRESLNEIYKEKGLTHIQAELKKVDPTYFNAVDISNPQRIIRALEVYKSSGIPFSKWRTNNKTTRNFKVITIGLEMDRALLYDRINQRVDNMMSDGLLEEVEGLYEHRNLPALQTVGYKELFNYIDNQYSLETAVSKIKQNSRKYAKRQITWFKKNKQTAWFNPNDFPSILSYIKSENAKIDRATKR